MDILQLYSMKHNHGAVFGRQYAVPQDIPGVHIHVSHDSENYQSNSMYNMQVTQHQVLQSPVHKMCKNSY